MKSLQMNDAGVALATAAEDSGFVTDTRRPAATPQPKIVVPAHPALTAE
jgi:hypothetical protein